MGLSHSFQEVGSALSSDNVNAHVDFLFEGAQHERSVASAVHELRWTSGGHGGEHCAHYSKIATLRNQEVRLFDVWSMLDGAAVLNTEISNTGGAVVGCSVDKKLGVADAVVSSHALEPVHFRSDPLLHVMHEKEAVTRPTSISASAEVEHTSAAAPHRRVSFQEGTFMIPCRFCSEKGNRGTGALGRKVELFVRRLSSRTWKTTI